MDETASQRSVRVSIVEDEVLLCSLLARTLDADPRLRVVHTARGVQEAALLITPGSTDVAILDVNLTDGNGISLGVQLQRADPRLSIMLLSGEDFTGLFTAVQQEVSRPWSYLSKKSTFTRDVLVRAVHACAEGRVVIDPDLARTAQPRRGSRVSALTPAQLRVVRLVAQGLTNRLIAERLKIQEQSVEAHLVAAYRTLELDSTRTNRRVAAVLAFLEQTGRIAAR
ncbi:DNA-binding NarL/FixJ family response regulator [Salana multivorans]|uniref:DNA-binding NarL/FixJ family response regulator n=1 Tax=Salana multivorans TaxID=120377 RepID=A0A3N2DBR6_9MICO|nr:response regulator transcription factor [Salana multivorans]ROR97177.1 DNA-binding NarL/FixJ family response regulator [Salana multivorans]